MNDSAAKTLDAIIAEIRGSTRLDGEEARGLLLMLEPGTRIAETGAADAEDMRPAPRFLTCSSVDDDKSTLIGRLLY